MLYPLTTCISIWSPREAGGWIVLAGDGPASRSSGGHHRMALAMAKAGLLVLDAAFPGAR